MGETTIRPSSESDLKNVEQHYGALDNIGDPFCDPSHTQSVNLEWLVIAEIDGVYAGFLYWHLGKNPYFAPEVARFAHIREVQVLEQFQRRGVGRRLLDYALQRLKALRVSDVFLSTADTNEVAKSLYENMGFKQFRTQIQYRLRLNDEIDQVMRRQS